MIRSVHGTGSSGLRERRVRVTKCCGNDVPQERGARGYGALRERGVQVTGCSGNGVLRDTGCSGNAVPGCRGAQGTPLLFAGAELSRLYI